MTALFYTSIEEAYGPDAERFRTLMGEALDAEDELGPWDLDELERQAWAAAQKTP
ncbi:hypothetical protein [Azospirillum argentinense]|uniref:hypothetical protein n=1 Tax=Azospirillum argentinense TaxID=2970906 RepID=UPI0032DF9EA6